MNKEYYVYMLRCHDNSIYTGITTNIDRRFEEHKLDKVKGAKYTKSHEPTKIERVWKTTSKSLASKLEFHIKTLKKIDKELLINENNLESLLGNKIDINNYEKKKI